MSKHRVVAKAQKIRRRNRERRISSAASKLLRRLGLEDIFEPELSAEQTRLKAVERAKEARDG